MNLPILARYIGNIRICDIDCGCSIIAKVNDVIVNPKDHFNVNQTGHEMLAQFRVLPAQVRRKIEMVTLVDEEAWPALVRQVDYLSVPFAEQSNELSMRHSLYMVLVIMLIVILLISFGGYYILLQAHNDRASSHILSVVDYLINLWIAITA